MHKAYADARRRISSYTYEICPLKCKFSWFVPQAALMPSHVEYGRYGVH